MKFGRFGAYLGALCVFSVVFLLSGCGGGSSSGGGTDVDGGGGSITTPSGGPSNTQFLTAIQKFKNDSDVNSYYESLLRLSDPIQTPNLPTSDLMFVRTALVYCRSKFSPTSTNFLDLTTPTAIETIKSTITESTGSASVPGDARVLLASTYLAQDSGLQTSSNIRGAISELEKLGISGSTFDPSFTYKPQLGIGITDAEAHAMLAFAYYLNDNPSGADNQLDIAISRDPTLSSDFLKNVKDILTILGVSK